MTHLFDALLEGDESLLESVSSVLEDRVPLIEFAPPMLKAGGLLPDITGASAAANWLLFDVAVSSS